MTSKPPHVTAKNIYDGVVYDLVRNKSKLPHKLSRSLKPKLKSYDNFEEIPEYLISKEQELQSNVLGTAKLIIKNAHKNKQK